MPRFKLRYNFYWLQVEASLGDPLDVVGFLRLEETLIR